MNEHPSKIYLLPNLMTAGNLFCGFTATLKILEGALLQSTNADAAADRFHEAIWFILGAFVFDFLDGRLARLGGHESSFGREFDSLADFVSFGVPAMDQTPWALAWDIRHERSPQGHVENLVPAANCQKRLAPTEHLLYQQQFAQVPFAAVRWNGPV